MIRRLALVAAVALAAVPSASAHAIPLTTSPTDGVVLAEAPAEATVTFDSGVRAGKRIAAVDSAGHSVLGGRPRIVGGRALVIPLVPKLPRGDYTVRWSVISDDGHEQEGLIAFGVGIGTPRPVPSLTVHGFVTWQRILMRTLFFLGVLGAAGVVAFVLLVLRPLKLEAEMRRREAGLLFGFFLLAFCGADALTHTAGVAGTRFEWSVTVAAITAGIGCIAAALSPVSARLRPLAWTAAGVLLLCPTPAGHALDASQPRVLAPIADLLHLAGASVWIGGLATLVAMAPKLSSEAVAAVLRRFSSIALPAVGVVAVAGVARALTELSTLDQVWSTGYGRALLAKSALLATALGVAWLARSAILARAGRGLRLLPVELVVLAGIVVAVGALTDLQPGRRAAASSRPASAAWFRLKLDPATDRTLELQLIASSHFVVHTYSGFDHSPATSLPTSR